MRWLVAIAAVLFAACGSASPSGPPPSESSEPLPSGAPATAAAASTAPADLVGEWERETRCEEIVAALQARGPREVDRRGRGRVRSWRRRSRGRRRSGGSVPRCRASPTLSLLHGGRTIRFARPGRQPGGRGDLSDRRRGHVRGVEGVPGRHLPLRDWWRFRSRSNRSCPSAAPTVSRRRGACRSRFLATNGSVSNLDRSPATASAGGVRRLIALEQSGDQRLEIISQFVIESREVERCLSRIAASTARVTRLRAPRETCRRRAGRG